MTTYAQEEFEKIFSESNDSRDNYFQIELESIYKLANEPSSALALKIIEMCHDPMLLLNKASESYQLFNILECQLPPERLSLWKQYYSGDDAERKRINGIFEEYIEKALSSELLDVANPNEAVGNLLMIIASHPKPESLYNSDKAQDFINFLTTVQQNNLIPDRRNFKRNSPIIKKLFNRIGVNDERFGFFDKGIGANIALFFLKIELALSKLFNDTKHVNSVSYAILKIEISKMRADRSSHINFYDKSDSYNQAYQVLSAFDGGQDITKLVEQLKTINNESVKRFNSNIVSDSSKRTKDKLDHDSETHTSARFVRNDTLQDHGREKYTEFITDDSPRPQNKRGRSKTL